MIKPFKVIDDAVVPQTLTATDIIVNNSVVFDTSPIQDNGVPGTVYWNVDDETLNINLVNGSILQVGQEEVFHVINQTGSTIEKGKVCVAVGTLGNSGKILVNYGIADGSINAKYFIGVTTQPIVNGDAGYVTNFGKVRGIDTTGTIYGETWTEGMVLYASPTTFGGFTSAIPPAPYLNLPIAFIVNSSSNNGEIFVRMTQGTYLNEVHDVRITTPILDNSLLQYNSSLSAWENSVELYNNINSNSANYILDGGNSKGDALTIGTNDANALNFETNNSTRMVVTTAGRVGIGNLNPTSMLYVSGNTNAEVAVFESTTVGAARVRIQGVDRSGIVAAEAMQVPGGYQTGIISVNGSLGVQNNNGGLAFLNTNATFQYGAIGGDARNGLNFMVGNPGIFSGENEGRTMMYFTSSFNVGINTFTPNVQFTVNGAVSSNNIIYDATSNSTLWASVYTSFNSQSASNASVYSTVNSNSATTWNYQGTDIKSLTGNWQNTYTTVQTNSSTWGGGGDTIIGASYNRWQIVGLSSTNVYSITGAQSDIEEAYRVTVGSVIQDPATYTVNASADTITFSSSVPQNSDIVIIEQIISTGGSGSGLTIFTEISSTASPNNTTTVHALSVNSLSANVDVVLAAKGNGATLAQIPDNGVSGGNKRGQFATDWQKSRGGAAQVASGDYSAIGGGRNNTASGGNSTVGGGQNNTANNAYAVIGGGQSNIASSFATVGGGASNIASGVTSVVGGGASNTASGEYSTIGGGYGAFANRYGMQAKASSYLVTPGDAQQVQFTLYGQAGYTNFTMLALDGINGNNYYITDNFITEKTLLCTILVLGTAADNTLITHVMKKAVISHNASFGTDTIISIQTLGTDSVNAGTVTFTNDENNRFVIECGSTSDVITNWIATVYGVEIITSASYA